MAAGRSRSPRSTCLPGRVGAPLLALAALLGWPPSPAAAQPGCVPQAVSLDTSSHQVGRLTSMGNGLARTAYQYDALGRATKTAFVLDGTTWTFSVAYGYPQNPGATPGPGSVLRSATFPDGEVVAYGYDASGARQTVTTTRPAQSPQSIVTGVLRNAREETTRTGFGNGVVGTRAYNDGTDLRLREIAATSSAGTTLQRLTYAYDANGNVLGTSDAVVAGYSASYGYDSLDQLTTMGGTVTGAYSYDSLGNLVAKDGVLQTYGGSGRGPHALAAAGAAVYSYDDDGNVASTSAGLNLTWNADNLAVRALQGAVEKNRKSFVGERLWKKVEGGVTTYYMPALTVENGACRKQFGAEAERAPDGALQFYHSDHLGSSTVVTNAAQQVSHRIAYLPWGEDRGVAGGSFQPRFQFNFKEKESTGLYDYGARLYNPAVGRWMSPDSGTGDGLNLYTYVRNNPLGYIDPTGNEGYATIAMAIYNAWQIDQAARSGGKIGIYFGGWRNTHIPSPGWLLAMRHAMGVSHIIFLPNHTHFFPHVFFGWKDKKQAAMGKTLIEYAAKRGVDTVVASFSNGVNGASSALQRATQKQVVFAEILEPNTGSESTMRGIFDNVILGRGIVQDSILDPKNFVAPLGTRIGEMYGILPGSKYPNVRIDLWGFPWHNRTLSLRELLSKTYTVPEFAKLDLTKISEKTLEPNP